MIEKYTPSLEQLYQFLEVFATEHGPPHGFGQNRAGCLPGSSSIDLQKKDWRSDGSRASVAD
jgi:hypothetical protein